MSSSWECNLPRPEWASRLPGLFGERRQQHESFRYAATPKPEHSRSNRYKRASDSREKRRRDTGADHNEICPTLRMIFGGMFVASARMMRTVLLQRTFKRLGHGSRIDSDRRASLEALSRFDVCCGTSRQSAPASSVQAAHQCKFHSSISRSKPKTVIEYRYRGT